LLHRHFGAPATAKVEPSSRGDDSDSSDGDPNFRSDSGDSGGPSRAV